jgi:exosortase
VRGVEAERVNPIFSKSWWLRVGVIAAAWLALYYDVVRRLISDWRIDENYSHGFFIPLISAYAIWTNRGRLAAIPCRPAIMLGVIVMLGAAILLFLGVLGAELYLTRISLLFSLAALALYFGGVEWLRQLSFPIGLLLLALPIPGIIFNQIALPLQLIASDYAARVIKLCGIPVLREGNVIELAQMKLQVVEACSGIRSLVSLATLAVVYAYFFESRWPRRLVIVASVVPIAIVANAARVAGTGIMAHHWGVQAAEGFMHSFSGWLVFVVAVILLLATAQAMNWFERIRRRSHNFVADDQLSIK